MNALLLNTRFRDDYISQIAAIVKRSVFIPGSLTAAGLPVNIL
jgi:hypothetical protein